MHCDYNINGVVHSACCYCSEYRVYADARFCLSAWWVDRLLPICGSLDRLHCNYNINGVVHSNDVSA